MAPKYRFSYSRIIAVIFIIYCIIDSVVKWQNHDDSFHLVANGGYSKYKCSNITYDISEYMLIIHELSANWNGIKYEYEECEANFFINNISISLSDIYQIELKYNDSIYFMDHGCPQIVSCSSICNNKYGIWKWRYMPLCCRNHLLSLLTNLSKELNSLNVTNWYLDGGTHLGAVRESGFIKYDYDIDIVADFKDRESFYKALSITIRNVPNSMIGVDPWTPRIDASMITIYGLKLEFWFYKRNGNNIIIDSTVVHNKLYSDVFPVKYLRFDGHLMPVPKNSHKILTHEYGENYMKQIVCNQIIKGPNIP